MPERIEPTDGDLNIRFGGGVNSRASEEAIDDQECFSGENFDIDLENHEFRNRPPVDLVATATNAAQINGFAQLLKADGTTSTLVQAGTIVYEWDGTPTGFVSKGTVSASARLRGQLFQNFTLDELVIITDLAKVENVQQWDGTTLAGVSFNTGITNFKAKYCFVSNERAWYGNVTENAVDLPHVIVGSEIEAHETISVADKPSSALGDADPFFVTTPDLRPINGLIESFGRVVASSREGSLFSITGTTAKDFDIQPLYPGSFAVGDESLVYVGNDIFYGTQGRIESVLATDTFGDVESDDLTRKISNLLSDSTSWTAAFNRRSQRVYFFQGSKDIAWIYHKSLRDAGSRLSPWVKMTTQSTVGLQPTAVMYMLDPSNSDLGNVFIGDADGNIYTMEGSGSLGDFGTSDISSVRTSKMFPIPLNADAYNVIGEIRYRRDEAASVTITFKYGGKSVFDQPIVVSLPGSAARSVYSGSAYYKNETYYGTNFRERLVRQPIAAAGQGTDLQVEVAVNGKTNFSINELILRFEVAS